MEARLDQIGECLFFAAILTPIITVLLFLRLKKIHWFSRVLLGLSIGLSLGALFWWISMEILFRNGMGS